MQPQQPDDAHPEENRRRGFGLAGLVSLRPLGEVVTAALLGLVVGGIMMAWAGYDWVAAYKALWAGSFGDSWGVADTLADATPLILTGLGFALCFRVGFFNIGAQGQMIVGTLAAVAAGSMIQAPPILHLLLVVLAAGLAGALWALPAAFLKATRGVHEVISTIMLNWIAFYLALYMVSQVLVDPARAERTLRVLPSVRLNAIIPGADLTWALGIAVVFGLAFYWLLWHSPWGYELRTGGLNPEALRYAGASPVWTINLTFLLAGAAAGLAGATQIIGRPPTYALYGDLSNLGQLGFDGIAVALIGRNHPIGIIFAAIFFGALATGARMMQITAGVPLDLIRVVHGVVIVGLAAPEAWSIMRKYMQSRASRTVGTGTAQAPAAEK